MQVIAKTVNSDISLSITVMGQPTHEQTDLVRRSRHCAILGA
jgi:hypothetical protein